MAERIVIEGKIIALKLQRSHFGNGQTLKMFVWIKETNTKLWGTVPKNLAELDGFPLKWSMVHFTAEIDGDFFRNARGAYLMTEGSFRD